MDSTNKKIFTEKDQFLTPTCPEKANAEELSGLWQWSHPREEKVKWVFQPKFWSRYRQSSLYQTNQTCSFTHSSCLWLVWKPGLSGPFLKHAFLREVYKDNTVLQGRSREVRCSRVDCWCWCAGSWRCLSPRWCGPACGSPCSRGQPWCQVSPGWSNTGTLSCSGPMFSAWLNPPIEPLLRLYVFNITNPEEVGVAGLDPWTPLAVLCPRSCWGLTRRQWSWAPMCTGPLWSARSSRSDTFILTGRLAKNQIKKSKSTN